MNFVLIADMYVFRKSEMISYPLWTPSSRLIHLEVAFPFPVSAFLL